jgi:hypothetical protein
MNANADDVAGLRDEMLLLLEERGELLAAVDREVAKARLAIAALDERIVDFSARRDELRVRAEAFGEPFTVPRLLRLTVTAGPHPPAPPAPPAFAGRVS